VSVLSILIPGVAGGIWIALFGAGCFAAIGANAVRRRRDGRREPQRVGRAASRGRE
jgi:hypothetical protein